MSCAHSLRAPSPLAHSPLSLSPLSLPSLPLPTLPLPSPLSPSPLTDKDDLKAGAGAEYIDVSSVVLCFCTEKYFQSRACAREIFRAVLQGKPLIAVLEPDAARGGLQPDAIKALLTKDRFRLHNQKEGAADQSWASNWALDSEVREWGFPAAPTGEDIVAALFHDDPIEYNRFTEFQIVCTRQVAERLLPEKDRGTVYVQGEAGNQTLSVPTLKRGRTFHLYCSPHNAGAKELGAELVEMLSRRIANASKANSKGDSKPLLKTTTSLDELDQCEHMLIYLTAKTWCNGEDSIAYAREVAIAQRKGVHLLLAHEYPCCLDALVPGGMSRGACEFNDFWNEGWTPKHLLTGDANVYKQIAMALKPGPFRAAGLAVVLNKMGEGGGERAPIELSAEVEEAGMAAYIPAQLQPKATADDGGGEKRAAAPPRKARASTPPAAENRAFQKRRATAGRRSQHKASQDGECGPPSHRATSSTLQAVAEAPPVTPNAAAALATLRRSCSAHDARRASASTCDVEAAGCGPAPLNTVGASLPTPSNLPCPKEGTIAQEAAGPSKTGTTTLTAGEAEEEEEEQIFLAMSSSIRRVQLSPAMLEDEDEGLQDALERVFEPGSETTRAAERSGNGSGSGGATTGRKFGGATVRRSVHI